MSRRRHCLLAAHTHSLLLVADDAAGNFYSAPQPVGARVTVTAAAPGSMPGKLETRCSRHPSVISSAVDIEALILLLMLLVYYDQRKISLLGVPLRRNFINNSFR